MHDSWLNTYGQFHDGLAVGLSVNSGEAQRQLLSADLCASLQAALLSEKHTRLATQVGRCITSDWHSSWNLFGAIRDRNLHVLAVVTGPATMRRIRCRERKKD
jgi:hypothetical protein